VDEFLRGGNIFFQKSLLEVFNGFDPQLGMSGQRIAYGEEGELQRRIRHERPEQLFYYDPKLYVLHLVRSEKMRLSWKAQAAIGKGRSRHLMLADSSTAPMRLPTLFLSAIKVLAVVGLEATYGALRRDRSRYPYLENYLYESVIWRLSGLGKLQAQFEYLMTNSSALEK
jgi:hypothetical protein